MEVQITNKRVVARLRKLVAAEIPDSDIVDFLAAEFAVHLSVDEIRANRRRLGLVHGVATEWSTAEIEVLKRLGPSEAAHVLGRDAEACRRRLLEIRIREVWQRVGQQAACPRCGTAGQLYHHGADDSQRQRTCLACGAVLLRKGNEWGVCSAAVAARGMDE